MLILLIAAAVAYHLAGPEIDWSGSRTIHVADPWRVRVIDGDTFTYGGEKVRIAGIDAPEINPPRCEREAVLGIRAKERLAALLAAGPFDMIAERRDEDKYQRKLRKVVRDGRPIGDLLVAEGLARRSDGARAPWCGTLLLPGLPKI